MTARVEIKLMNDEHMRNSPLARTPPRNLPDIPGVMSDFANKDDANNDVQKGEAKHNNKAQDADDQFSMEI